MHRTVEEVCVFVKISQTHTAHWSWHIDPETVEFADVTIELCDGRPSYIEDGTLTTERFCPWDAEVVAVEPVD